MIDSGNWEELAGAEEERRRAVRRRNRAFRRQLEEDRRHRRELLKLRLVSALALGIWTYVAVRVL